MLFMQQGSCPGVSPKGPVWGCVCRHDCRSVRRPRFMNPLPPASKQPSVAMTARVPSPHPHPHLWSWNVWIKFASSIAFSRIPRGPGLSKRQQWYGRARQKFCPSSRRRYTRYGLQPCLFSKSQPLLGVGYRKPEQVTAGAEAQVICH